jgi:hypothetical protein
MNNKEYLREYYLKHKYTIKQRSANRYREHLDECKKTQKEYYEANKESFIERNKRNRDKKPEYYKELNRTCGKAYRLAHREEIIERCRKYNKTYKRKHPTDPIQDRARSLVNEAIRHGRLIRQSCQLCNKPNAHAHHEDYSKPFEIMWLCRSCHINWHLKSKKSGRNFFRIV